MGRLSDKLISKVLVDFLSENIFPCFVETGTFKGETTLWASSLFARVYTIELNESYLANAKVSLGHKNNIAYYLGDSRGQLPVVLDSIDSSCVLWLDAHSGGGFFSDHDDCPILEELCAINKSGLKSLILIDDVRGFMAPPPPPFDYRQWPNIYEVLDCACDSGKRYPFVADDVIAAVPVELFDSFRKSYHKYKTKL